MVAAESWSILITGASRGLGHELRGPSRPGAGPSTRSCTRQNRLSGWRPSFPNGVFLSSPTSRGLRPRGDPRSAGRHGRTAGRPREQCRPLREIEHSCHGRSGRTDASARRPLPSARSAAQAALLSCGAGPQPAVVNVSSRFGSVPRNASGEFAALKVSYSYRIAKAAQNMLTLSMSLDPSLEGITVCAVHPGRFATGNRKAAVTAEEAARRLAGWIEQLDPTLKGTFTDLDTGAIGW